MAPIYSWILFLVFFSNNAEFTCHSCGVTWIVHTVLILNAYFSVPSFAMRSAFKTLAP